MKMNCKQYSEENIFMILLLFTAFLICISHKFTPHFILIKNSLLYFSKISKKRYPKGVTQFRFGEEEDKGGEECSVCLCEIKQGDEIMKLPCHHFFHAVCLDKWLVSYGRCTCPFCRASLCPSSPSSSSGAGTVEYSESGVEVLSLNFFSSASSRGRDRWGLM